MKSSQHIHTISYFSFKCHKKRKQWSDNFLFYLNQFLMLQNDNILAWSNEFHQERLIQIFNSLNSTIVERLFFHTMTHNATNITLKLFHGKALLIGKH